MEHVHFTHRRSSRVLGSGLEEGSYVTATHTVAWVDGYDRPLLCARVPTNARFLAMVHGFDNQTHVKLFNSPLRYTDPPLDSSASPTGAPWVVYCEKNPSKEPLPPLWFAAAVKERSNPDSYWEPLSAAWKLKDALAPVVDVVRKRHQPFVARLHEEQGVLKAIRIGERDCRTCGGTGESQSVGIAHPCVTCDGTGTTSRWSISIQCTRRGAPMLDIKAVDNDLSTYYLWEVSSNVDRTELSDILLRKHPNILGPWANNIADRFCDTHYDTAYNVPAKDIQRVIDALEWEAQNTGGPVITEPPTKNTGGSTTAATSMSLTFEWGASSSGSGSDDFDSTADMKASFHKANRIQQEHSERSQFKRKDTKRSTKGRR